MIFEQEALKKNVFMVSNNLEQDFMYVGLKAVIPADFTSFDFYTITVSILVVIAISLLVVFLILNNSLDKLIEKEEKENQEE